MVNYDLPWNPNRIEQRFGRIHRIGQDEVCRLWNLVADNTREGEVFTRLLAEDRGAAQGLRRQGVRRARRRRSARRRCATLLIDAIRYGELPETQGEDGAGHRRQRRPRDRGAARRARARDRHAAARGHRAAARADGRGAGPAPAAALHRGRVPGGVHAPRRQDPASASRAASRSPTSRRSCARPARGPIATRYERVTFDLEHVLDDDGRPRRAARPGPPAARRRHRRDRRPLAADARARHRPRLADAARSRACSSASSRRSPTRPETAVARRFSYAYIDEHGTVEAAGPAPYLDCVAAPLTNDGHRGPGAAVARGSRGARRRAGSSPTSSRRSSSEVKLRREAELHRVRDQVERAPRSGEQPPHPRGDGRPGEGAGRQEAQGEPRRA